jgi:hypothetical protein
MFGIEGGVLLHPDDHLRALQLFNEAYESAKSPEEDMRTAYERILKTHPDLEQRMQHLPKRLFSNKRAEQDLPKGLFACYRFPAATPLRPQEQPTQPAATLPGDCRWYFLALDGSVSENPPEIHQWIQCQEETPRATQDGKPPISKLKQIEAHINKSELKKRVDLTMEQVGAGENALQLICWMDVV